jgi:putative SOS response-associated peptidase YedK
MCSNYQPVTLQDRLLAHFGVTRPEDSEPPEVTFPGYSAPFIVSKDKHAEASRLAEYGLFGLLPHWAKDVAFGRKTYNCRAETMAEKPSFKTAWSKGFRCIVPAEAIHEPCYETGKAVKHAIKRRDGSPMGIAGLWGVWRDPEGRKVLSFTMLTISGAGHAIFQRMHKPEDEKRMVVILQEKDYDDWLNCSNEDALKYLVQYPAELLIDYPLSGPDPTRIGG